MASDLQKLKKDVDMQSEYLIFGFVRESQTLFPQDNQYYNIPDLIAFVILSFYYIGNEWDKELTSEHFKIEDDLLTVVEDDNYSTNAWLNRVISDGIHSWRLKVEDIHEQIHDYFDFVIGVTTLTRGPVNSQNTWFCGSNGTLYDQAAYGNPYEKYADTLKKGDIVEMIINMHDLTLKYVINGKDHGKACDLEAGRSYRAAIYMYNVGGKLRIV